MRLGHMLPMALRDVLPAPWPMFGGITKQLMLFGSQRDFPIWRSHWSFMGTSAKCSLGYFGVRRKSIPVRHHHKLDSGHSWGSRHAWMLSGCYDSWELK